jgi:hypothetical protein
MAVTRECPDTTDGRHDYDAPCQDAGHGHQAGARVCVCGAVYSEDNAARAEWDNATPVPHPDDDAERTPAAMLERVKVAIEDAEERIHDALGAALVAAFPEATTGDESPDAVFSMSRAVERAVVEWVQYNVIPEDAGYTLDDCPTHGLSISTDDAPHAHP